MSHAHRNRYVGVALVLTGFVSCASLQAAPIIPSPANDILLSSNGGTADINGTSADGAANYPGLPAANLNDGDRAGNYSNGGGVDGFGSIAHTANPAAGNEMGVTISTPTLIGTVDVFNRTDCCNTRIDGGGAEPFTLNIFNGATLAFTHDYAFNPSITLTNGANSASGMVIPVGVLGNYVQIIQHHNDYMNLAELEAYTNTPEPASLTVLGLGTLGLLIRRR